MLANQLIERYQAFCPPELAMEGDVSGLQIGTLNKEIKRVLVALDIRETTVAEAIDKQVDLIIHGGYLGQQPTTVIDLTEDSPVVLREGVGDVKPFL